jgi:hypothetical protein
VHLADVTPQLLQGADMPGLVFVMLTTQLQGSIGNRYYSAPFAPDQIADCEHDTPVTTQPVVETLGHFRECTINGCNFVGFLFSRTRC